MKLFLTILLTSFFLFIIGCTPFSKPLLLEDEVDEIQIQESWKKYGAYYEVNELFVESSYLEAADFSSMASQFIINRKLRILTTEGLQYATIDIPVYGMSTDMFNITLRDSAGLLIPIPLDSIKREYMQKEKIIIPKATVGSTISIQISFKNYLSLTQFEHYIYSPIPIQKAKFTFSVYKKFTFDYKTYGKVPDVEIGNPTQKHTYYSWTLHNILPQAELSNQRNIDENIPRISLIMRSAFGRDIVTTWKKQAENYSRFVLKESIFSSSKSIQKLTDSITKGHTKQIDKANIILRWVQDNISLLYGGISAINIDNILKKRSGTVWEISVLTREMFEHIGLKSDILITRSRNYGGFDKEFITPLVLQSPLISVKIDTTEYVAYPFTRGGVLGEFPYSFWNLYGLSVLSKAPKKIPDPISKITELSYNYTIDLEDTITEPIHTCSLSISGYGAYYERNNLLTESKELQKEKFQNILSSKGKSNALHSYTVLNLDTYGKALEAKIDFKSPGQVINRANKKILKLGDFFETYYDFYDTSRIENYYFDIEYIYHENITVLKKNRKVTLNLECLNIDNGLFNSSCKFTDTQNLLLIERKITAKTGDFNREAMKKIYPDILELNKIKNSSLVIE